MIQTRCLRSPNKSPLEKHWMCSQCPLSITILPRFLPVPSAPLLQLRTRCQPFPLQLCKGDIATETTARLSLSSRPGLPPPRCQPKVPCDGHSGPPVGTTAQEGAPREVHALGWGVLLPCGSHDPLVPAAATRPACHFLDTLQPSEKPASLPRCFCDQMTPT